MTKSEGSWPGSITEYIPSDRLHDLTELAPDDLEVLLAGCDELPVMLSGALSIVLESWDDLDGSERLAALVALAEAFASINS